MNMMKTILPVMVFVCSVTMSIAYGETDLRIDDLPSGTEQVTFVELGSVKCIPCKQMEPVMEAIKEAYAKKVKVVFHDVWAQKGQLYAEAYGIRIIPTQVFVNKKGEEIFRHEGYFPQEEIETVLHNAGVEK